MKSRYYKKPNKEKKKEEKKEKKVGWNLKNTLLFVGSSPRNSLTLPLVLAEELGECGGNSLEKGSGSGKNM